MPDSLDPHQVLPLLQCLSGAALLLWLARSWSWWPQWSGTSPGEQWGKALSIAVGGVLLVPVLALMGGFHLAKTQGVSMAPTLQPGQTLLCAANAYMWRWPFLGIPGGFVRVPRPGEVITLHRFSRTTGKWVLLVKRVVAVPGDNVTVAGGHVWINGHLDETGPLPAAPPSPPVHWHLGAREVFVVGDNRARSQDSRHWGPVPLDQVSSRVLAVHTEQGWLDLRGSRP